MKGNGREAERLARATLLGVLLGVVLARLCRKGSLGLGAASASGPAFPGEGRP